MKKSLLWWGIVLSVGLGQLSAQSFTFYSTFRAGRPNNADWQMGIGTAPNATERTANYAWNSSTRTWRADGEQNFEIGWDAATNTAYSTVWNEAGLPTTVSRSNPGAALSTMTNWTLPGSGFWAAISDTPANAASIALANLTLSPNTSLVSGSFPSTFGISRPAGTGAMFESLAAPIVINAASNGGNWFLRGTVAFTGLQGQQGGGLTGSRSQFFLTATGLDPVPDAPTFALLGSGMLLLGWQQRNRHSRVA
jgi:hypothetical protein